MTPKASIGANNQFFIYYLYFPVLLIIQRFFLTNCDYKTVLKITTIVLTISMIVLYYQVIIDSKFLVKWSKEASYVKPDGLATDPNSYVMCAALLIPAILLGITLMNSLNWRIFFLSFRSSGHRILGAAVRSQLPLLLKVIIGKSASFVFPCIGLYFFYYNVLVGGLCVISGFHP